MRCLVEVLLDGKTVLIDAESYTLVRAHKWHYNKSEAKRAGLYYMWTHIRIGNKDHKNSLHRMILGIPVGAKVHVDHINGNSLDNRKSNLRITDSKHNQWNRKIGKSNKSGYKGVGWHKASGKWRVRLTAHKTEIYGGLFTDIMDAARAYDKLASMHYGEYARLNFPKEALHPCNSK